VNTQRTQNTRPLCYPCLKAEVTVKTLNSNTILHTSVDCQHRLMSYSRLFAYHSVHKSLTATAAKYATLPNTTYLLTRKQHSLTNHHTLQVSQRNKMNTNQCKKSQQKVAKKQTTSTRAHKCNALKRKHVNNSQILLIVQ